MQARQQDKQSRKQRGNMDLLCGSPFCPIFAFAFFPAWTPNFLAFVGHEQPKQKQLKVLNC
jgi:hypothetical protein